MENNRAKLVSWGFLAGGALMIFAAIVPVLKGGNANAAYLSVGALMLIIAMAVRKKKSA